jgi:type VII secretion-associated serine protease mycosin
MIVWPIRPIASGAVLGLLAVLVGTPRPAVADAVRDAQWHLTFLDIARAHQYSQGAGAVVAVVDSGVDTTHPDLTGNVVPGAEIFAGSPGGNGWTDTDGHGTAMAGLIAAHGHGDGVGALGIAPKATILPLRVGPSGLGALSDIPDGVSWATDHGAKVISISAYAERPNPDLEEAIRRAITHDVVVVAAAGNVPQTDQVWYPAAYPGVVAVGGVDRNGNHAKVSVTGRDLVLSAPAVDIETVGLGHRYAIGTGTSDATAIVAGAAALVRSRFPSLSATEVIHRLTATAIDKGPPGRDDQYGYGIVNPVGALTADVPSLQASSSPHPSRSAASANGVSTRHTSPFVWLFVGLTLVLVVAVGIAVMLWRRPAR